MRRVLDVFADVWAVLRGDTEADRVVPPTGFTASLTLFASAAMAFLTVFALALSLATGRLAERWSSELARSATIRISAPAGQVDAQTKAVVRVLETTPGIASIRILDEAEQRALLEPWFGLVQSYTDDSAVCQPCNENCVDCQTIYRTDGTV